MLKINLTVILTAIFFIYPGLELNAAQKKSSMPVINSYERQLIENNLIDIQKVDASIKVELKYASENNFMKRNVYGDLNKCYLQSGAAEKLALACRYLKKIRPGLSLVVVDGFRPRNVQYKMWEIVKGTSMQRYVADPEWGSMHNYGCAVDITLAGKEGKRLDMGTPVDYFGELAQPRLEEIFLKQGKLTSEQVANRRLLRKVMTAAGFHPISIEWWHFDAFEKDTVRKNYCIIE